jgi:hypothetical protein
MLARIFRLSTALCISAAAWLHQPVTTISCGPDYDGEDVHITCFDPSVLPDSLYAGYFPLAIGDAVGLSSEDEFNWPEDTTKRFDRNIEEWGEYLAGRVPLQDIEEFVYDDRVEYLELLFDVMRQGDSTISTEIRGSLTAKEILRRGDTAMLRYLIYAKLCESCAFTDPYYWKNEPATPADFAGLIARGRAEYSTCRSETLRLRYGYQLVRLAHYGGFHQEAIHLYDSMVIPNPASSIVRYYTMLQRAGIQAKRQHRGEALYLLSQVFDHHADARWRALHDFNIDSSITWDTAYAMARTNHERSVLWMMRGLTEYTLDTKPIEEMVRLDPHDPRLDVMLLREVREVERRLYSDRVTKSATFRHTMNWRPGAQFEDNDYLWMPYWSDSSDNQRYATRLAQLAERCADRRLIPNRALWYAVAGYMRIIDGDFNRAERNLDRANVLVEGNRKLDRQILALRLLAQIRDNHHLSAAVVSQQMEALKWIDQYQSDGRPYVPEIVLLGQKFLKQGDVVRAAGAFARGGDWTAVSAVIDFYATDKDLLRLQRILQQPRRSLLDTMLFNSFPYSPLQIVDLRATRMMRRGRFVDAVRLWDELDTSKPYLRTTTDTVTVEAIVAAGEFEAVVDTLLPHQLPSDWKPVYRKFTRPAFAREIFRFQQLARQNPANAERYTFAIARAIFSTARWGYSDQLWDNWMVWRLRYHFSPTRYPFNISPVSSRMVRARNTFLREYGSNELARQYFDMVRRTTSNHELAARCAYEMDRARKDLKTRYHPRPRRQDRTGYNLLRTRYRKTDFAEHILSNCGTYEWFTTHQ